MNECWRKRLQFGFASFLTLWTILLMFELANPVQDSHMFSYKTDTGTSVSDFVHFYQCGLMAWSDKKAQVYDPAVQLEFTNRLISPDHIENVFYIQYVPFLFPLLMPLATLPLPVAFPVWYALSLTVGIASVAAAVLASKRFSRYDLWLLLTGLMASCPSIICLKIGQLSWFLLSFWLWVYLSFKHKRDLLAGLSLALTTIKPQYAPLIFFASLCSRRWKYFLAALASEALLLTLAGLTVGWQNVIGYPQILLAAETSASVSGVNPEGMVSVRGMLSWFLPQRAVLAVTFAILALACFIVFVLWDRARKNELPLEWAIALTVVAGLVVSPHSHVYDLLLVCVPAVLTLPTLSLVEIARLKQPSLRIWSCILVTYPLVSWIVYMLRQPSIFVGMNIALFLAGTAYLRRKQSN